VVRRDVTRCCEEEEGAVGDTHAMVVRMNMNRFDGNTATPSKGTKKKGRFEERRLLLEHDDDVNMVSFVISKWN